MVTLLAVHTDMLQVGPLTIKYSMADDPLEVLHVWCPHSLMYACGDLPCGRTDMTSTVILNSPPVTKLKHESLKLANTLVRRSRVIPCQ